MIKMNGREVCVVIEFEGIPESLWGGMATTYFFEKGFPTWHPCITKINGILCEKNAGFHISEIGVIEPGSSCFMVHILITDSEDFSRNIVSVLRLEYYLNVPTDDIDLWKKHRSGFFQEFAFKLQTFFEKNDIDWRIRKTEIKESNYGYTGMCEDEIRKFGFFDT